MYRLGLHIFAPRKLGFTVLSLKLCMFIKYSLGFTVEILYRILYLGFIVQYRAYAELSHIGFTRLRLTFNAVLTMMIMMMITRVLMSRVDVDDPGVNNVHSGVDHVN